MKQKPTHRAEDLFLVQIKRPQAQLPTDESRFDSPNRSGFEDMNKIIFASLFSGAEGALILGI